MRVQTVFEMRSVIVSLVLALSASFIMAQDKAEPLKQVSKGIESFSTNFFKEIAKKHEGNLISSPLSAHLILAMAAYGADGNTAKQLRQSLNLPATDAVGQEGFKNLIDHLTNVENVTLEVANKMYIADGLELKSDFKKLTSGSFNSEASPLDLETPDKSAKLVNDWVKEKTHEKITSILNRDDISSDLRLILLNAVYFKGKWATEFKKQNTRPKAFHIDEKTEKMVPTMFISGNFKYGELPDLNAKFIELPYQNKDFKMIIIVPNEINGLKDIEENLQSFNYTRLSSEAVSMDVDLYLPKFKIESKIDLVEPLKLMGMTDMFNNNANFSRISNEHLKVDKVLQKAFIEVNEEGSTAAAVTGFAGLSAIPGPPKLIKYLVVDRPFYYSIVYYNKISASQNSLFQGSVRESPA